MVSAGEDDPVTPAHFEAGFAQQTGSCRGPTERLCPGRAGGEVVTPGAPALGHSQEQGEQ